MAMRAKKDIMQDVSDVYVNIVCNCGGRNTVGKTRRALEMPRAQPKTQYNAVLRLQIFMTKPDTPMASHSFQLGTCTLAASFEVSV